MDVAVELRVGRERLLAWEYLEWRFGGTNGREIGGAHWLDWLGAEREGSGDAFDDASDDVCY